MEPEVQPETAVVTPEVTTPETKTAAELAAEAKALEEENKALKSQKSEEELIRNQERRLEKAKQENELLKGSQETEVLKSNEVDTRDLITLSKNDIPEGSEKAKILQKYKDAKLISDFASGLDHVGIKAEFDALDAKNTAHTIIDENADQETQMMTTKEVIKRFQATGEIPKDPKLQDAIAKDNLKRMGLR
jgi:hypothetical protein